MAGEDETYLKWIRRQRCCVEPCPHEPVQAHHRTGHGMSMKNHDHEAMPLCWYHHRELHGLWGYFAEWTRRELHDWQWEQIRHYRGIYENKEAF